MTQKKSSKGSKRQKPKLRSGLEDKVRKQLDNNKVKYEYETHKIEYTVPAVQRSYTPDFIIFKSSGEPIFIEVKGRWTHEDQYKHYFIRSQHPELDIRFIFQRADNRVSKGSKRSYRSVCEGDGYGLLKGHIWKYSDRGVLPQEWLME